MSDAPFTVGLVGASDIAATRMLPALAALGMSVAGVFDPEERRLARWADSTGPVVRTARIEELLAADIDAVYVSTRNEQHRDHAVAAARAGKHVLLEKPMALDVAQAREIVAAADDNGVTLAVNHHLPGSPLHVAARQLVATGRIGHLLSARIDHAGVLPERLRGWRLSSGAGAGVILDLTVHDASVLNPLFGAAPVRVTALAVSQARWNAGDAADSAMTVLEYGPDRDGHPRLAQTHDSFTVPFHRTRMEIHGDAGSLVIVDAMTQDAAGELRVIDADGQSVESVDCDVDLYEIVLDRFRAAARGAGSPTVTGTEGLDALTVALAAQESVRTGRAVALAELTG